MKFNVSVLAFGLVVLALNFVLIIASSSEDGLQSSMAELSPAINPSSVESKVRVNRRAHCGVRTFKLLMLICTNDLKFPATVERQDSKGEFGWSISLRFEQQLN